MKKETSVLLHTPCCFMPYVPHSPGHACTHCGSVYPLLGGKLPILIPSPVDYLQQSFDSLKNELHRRIEQLLKLKKNIKISPAHRIEHLKLIAHAYEKNTQLLSELVSTMSLTPHAAPLSKKPLNNRYTTLDICLNYLQRDWGTHPDSQEEVATIETRLNELIQTHGKKLHTALFIGAGLGRFAYDLSARFEHTIAIDNSILMGYFYQKIQQQDIELYSIKLSNTQYNAQQCRLVHASVQHAEKPVPQCLPTYAIADITHLPLAAQSVSAIISIYFTDVLPWSRLWPEVLRVLQPGGMFIHYGPLQYHTQQLHENYSAEDLRIYIEAQGFKVADEQWRTGQHLKNSIHSNILYNNWSFVAIRNQE